MRIWRRMVAIRYKIKTIQREKNKVINDLRKFHCQSYRESDASVYSTYNLRESLVDPDANERVVGVSRETYIGNTSTRVYYYGWWQDVNLYRCLEPNTSTIVQKHVTPQSIYGAQYLQTAAPSSTSFLSGPSLNFFNDESTESLSIDIPSRPSSQQQEQQPRVQHADSPVRMQQAFVNVPQPSSAIIEQTQNHHQHHPVGNRQHPQPLPPLVIPPTPCSSAPPTHQEQQEQHLQPQQDSAPPHLSPGTPASSRSGGSPHTPSPNTLLPPTSTNDFLRPSSPTGQQPPLSPTVPPTAAYSGGNFTNKLTKKMQKEPEPANEAEALVGQGIKYHEAGQLAKATECFRQAAIKDSPIGMFLYGVSLRHGWGCKRNEHTAFQYLQKAAEHAVMDLNSLSSTVNTSAVKGELIMAIYELGVSFRHGWGVSICIPCSRRCFLIDSI